MARRREFVSLLSRAALGGALAGRIGSAREPDSETRTAFGERVSMDGEWLFRIDPESTGESKGWAGREAAEPGWERVSVPHTWQIAEETAEYWGVAWYRRSFDVPEAWSDRAVRIEFEAVFHSARVWVNGVAAGEHLGKGYTAFTLDITSLLRIGERNSLAVQVDNDFNENMLPRGRSSDWTHDGGIYRPVSLHITPKVFIERVDVDALPDLAGATADLDVSVVVRNSGATGWQGKIACLVADDASGLTVSRFSASATVPAGQSRVVKLPAERIANVKLWHFDHPNLYRLEAAIPSGDRLSHAFETTFGVRGIEVRDNAFYFNGERVWLMGVERMGGSNPEFGMAEPPEWLIHDHEDMKELNCVFTRVHWQQDRRVLDYCDRHGILIQLEIPTWGPRTFAGMDEDPDPAIMQNGLEQLREMIERDRNHPCVFSWGLCNEINGQNPPAYKFAGRMYEEARKLDRHRLLSYASNSLQKTPGRDVSRLMDFIEWNEYYETWYGGTTEVEMARNIEEIHRAFPGKPIVISEYGWCSCTDQLLEHDEKRIGLMRRQNAEFRRHSYIGGLIYFCYNDYRTHIGHKGVAVMKQRGGGVVDLYGHRKSSFEALRAESSPVKTVELQGEPPALEVRVTTRESHPAYRLAGYSVRAVVYGFGDVPLERYSKPLPTLDPGDSTSLKFQIKTRIPARVEVDVMRPTGYSVLTAIRRS